MTESINHKGVYLMVTFDEWENGLITINEVSYNGMDVMEIYDQNTLMTEIEELIKIKIK